MAEHVCHELSYCMCSGEALEPSEDCPVHGNPWPPRCGECGRYLPRREPADIVAPGGAKEVTDGD